MLKYIVLSILIIVLNTTQMTQGIYSCEKDGFYPDKQDCWIYHICDNGVHSVHACEDELYFNPQTGLCDWPINVNCTVMTNRVVEEKTTRTTITTLTTTQMKISTQLQHTQSIQASQNTINEQKLCNAEDYGYMQHPYDCRKYIYCQDGITKVFSCQGGLYWKQSDGNCVWPLDSNCQNVKKSNTNMNTNTNTNSIVQSSLIYNTNSEVNLKQSRNTTTLLKDIYHSIECTSDMSGFYPDLYDCSVYHFCNGDKDQIILCEPGLYFNSEKKVCDWPTNSKCIQKCPSDNEKYRFMDPKSCCRYYECMNGQLVLQSCQYPLLFDVNTKQCVDYAKVKCGTRKECLSPCQYFTNDDTSLCDVVPNCNGKPHGIYLDQNRENCQFFYTCRDNRVFNHSRCPNQQRFNQYEGRCMPSKLVTCSTFSFIYEKLYAKIFIYQIFFLLIYFKNSLCLN